MRYIKLILVISIVMMSGCLGLLDGGEEEVPADNLELVPEGSNSVGVLDMSILEQGDFVSVADRFFDLDPASSQEDDISDFGDFLDTYEEESGFDLREINSIVVFSERDVEDIEDVEDYVDDMAFEDGYLVSTDYTEDEVLEKLEELDGGEGRLDDGDANLDTSEYKEFDVHRLYDDSDVSEDVYISSFDEGEFVVSFEESTVEDVLDVVVGDEEGLEQIVVDEINSVDDGYQFVGLGYSPEEGFEESFSVAGVGFDAGSLSMFLESNAYDEEELEEVVNELDEFMEESDETIDGFVMMGMIDEDLAEDMKTAVDNIEYNVDNGQFTIEFTVEVSLIEEIIEVFFRDVPEPEVPR